MSRKFRVVELYAGTGRTWESFRRWRRCRLGLLIDVDELCAQNYSLNYSSDPYLRRDLRWMSPSEVEAQAGGRVDILLGCPPCQGFSDTGKRDPDDPRNIHIGVFGRFIKGLKPLAVAMENVPLVANSNRFHRFTRMLDALGYRWIAHIINASQYGSCQTRQRLLLLAVHNDVRAEPKIPAPTHGAGGKYFSYNRQKLVPAEECEIEFLGLTPAAQRLESQISVARKVCGRKAVPEVGEILAGLPRLGSAEAELLTHVPWPSSAAMKHRMSRVPEGGRWRGGKDHFSHSYGRLHRRGLSRTITTYFANPGSGRFWHPTEERPITVREAARIQGFDDGFLFQGPLRGLSRLVGNALDNGIASVAYRTVRSCLE